MQSEMQVMFASVLPTNEGARSVLSSMTLGLYGKIPHFEKELMIVDGLMLLA